MSDLYQHLNLKEILEKEEFILADTSISNSSSNFLKEIYDYDSYYQLNKEDLGNLLENLLRLEKDLELYISFVSSDKVKVIPEVVEELGKFEEIVSEKVKRFNENEKGLSKKIRYEYQNTYKFQEIYKIKRHFNNLCYLINKSVKKANKSSYKPKKFNEYESIVEAVKLLTDKAELKKKKINFDNFELSYKQNNSNDTDEKLVAALLNASLEGNSAALVSRDGDFTSILAISYKLLSSEDLYPYNKTFKEKLNENPVKLYLPTPPLNGEYKNIEYKLKFVSNKSDVNDHFIIYKLSEEENEEVKNKIKILLNNLK